MNCKKIVTLFSFFLCFGISLQAQFGLRFYQLEKEDTLQSQKLGYEKVYSVYLPKNFDSSKKYPVLLHFDARHNQTYASIEQIDEYSRSGQIPPFVLVTINSKLDNTERALEVLLPEMVPVYNGIPNQKVKTAKGKELGEFLFRELIPLLEENYSIDKQQVVLVGHSYYGFYTGYLFKEYMNEVFAVISNSPYFQIGQVNLIDDLRDVLLSTDSLPHKTYFYTGIGSPVHGDDRVGWKMMDDILKKMTLPKNLEYNSYDYPFAAHNSVPVLTTGRALCEIYSEWFLINASDDQKRWANQLNEQEILANNEEKKSKIWDYYGVPVPLR